jgi:hypothetical protein
LKAGAKLENFAVQKIGGFSQGFPEEIQEAPQRKTLNAVRLRVLRNVHRQFDRLDDRQSAGR